MLESACDVREAPCWFALRTKSRHEKLVRDRIMSLGLEPLLPMVRRFSQWKDRRKEIEVPLFSGYCFVKCSLREKNPILRVSGVVEIVGQGKQPEPIPDVEIQSIKTLIMSVLPYDSHPYLHEGMFVEVIRGPLRGIRGVLLHKERRNRLVIGIPLIQQAASVEIDASDVVPT